MTGLLPLSFGLLVDPRLVSKAHIKHEQAILSIQLPLVSKYSEWFTTLLIKLCASAGGSTQFTLYPNVVSTASPLHVRNLDSFWGQNKSIAFQGAISNGKIWGQNWAQSLAMGRVWLVGARFAMALALGDRRQAIECAEQLASLISVPAVNESYGQSE